MEQEQKTEGGGRRAAIGNGQSATGNGAKACPFCGGAAQRVTHARWSGEMSPGATCSNPACEICGMNFTLAWWNTRSDERTEFGAILAGLRARGLITQADVDRMERDGLKEVPA